MRDDYERRVPSQQAIHFICNKCRKRIKKDFIRLDSVKFSACVDSKGRISIPSDIRRSFGVNSGDFVQLELRMKKERR